MLQKIDAVHNVDGKGMPAGGRTLAVGLRVDWQNGPLGRGRDRKEPNGCFVETLIDTAKDRIVWYQTVCACRFECKENAIAIEYLNKALRALGDRTGKREEREVEGTHEA